MNVRTCYDILRVSREATLDEAKEAYKRLVKLWHPDQYGNFPEKQRIAQEKLKEINVAYRDVVTILKNSPLEAESSAGDKENQRHHAENPETGSKKGTAFWRAVSRYIHTNILKISRSENPKEDTRLTPDKPQDHNAASLGEGIGAASDFQQIFERAVTAKRLGRGGRQRPMKRKRIRNSFGNAASYRVRTTPKRSPGDRVEKITPIGRVNRIGGD